MGWTRADKKGLRSALQDVYRDYNSLEIFVADELGWSLPTIAANGQNLEKVTFELVKQAEAKGCLERLYKAFRSENSSHQFQVEAIAASPTVKPPPVQASQPQAQPSVSQDPSTSPESNLLTRRRLIKYGGAGVAWVTTISLVGPRLWGSDDGSAASSSEPISSEAQEFAQTNVRQSPSPDDTGEVFTFETASVSSYGEITRSQGKGRRRIFDLGGTPLEMVWVPAGSFMMGSPESEKERRTNEGPRHRVTIAEGFWMGRYPITRAQWRWGAKLNTYRRSLVVDSSSAGNDNRPVQSVSWPDAQEFCSRLSQKLFQESHRFRLPSESQWEYACRACTTTPFAFGETLTKDVAVYDGDQFYGDGPIGKHYWHSLEVGRLPANAWGLHDMHGNVWEWCEDLFHDSYDGAPSDGTPWSGSDPFPRRVLRGGGYDSSPRMCRSAVRAPSYGSSANSDVGFRVVCA